MARIRSVKPEFWNDRRLARLSRDARLLYIALWNLSDEHGRLHGDARYIKGHALPYDDDLDLDAVDELIDELEEHGRVQRYEHDGDPYLYLPNLAKHQRLEADKQASRLPEPPSSDLDAGKSAESPDKSVPADESSGEIVAKQVAGSREQVAGTPAPVAALPDRFSEFWQAYPRRTARGAAVKAWKSAMKKQDPDTIIVAASAFATSTLGTDPKFIPHPASWLNAERWADEPVQLRALPAPEVLTVEQMRGRRL